MAEYIEREALLDRLNKRLKNPAIIGWLCRIIAEVPAADVAPVVHGRWDAKGYCTNCGGRYIGYECAEWRTKYCPHCGAKMKGTVSLD